MTQESNVIPDTSTNIIPADAAPSEKMLPQSKVDEIVKHAKFDAAEKVRREFSSQPQPAPQQVAPSLNQASTGMGGMPAPDNLREIIAEETRKQQQALMDKAQNDAQMQEGQRIAGEFFGKLKEGASKHEDFDAVVGGLPFAQIPQIVQLANSSDNTSDVMYELAKNPMKLAGLSSLLTIDPSRAASEIRKLSDSIRSNETAKKSELANDPMSQIQPSPNSTDAGAKTVSDYRKIYR